MFKSIDLTPALFFAVFVVAFGSAFQHGYHTGVLNSAQLAVQQWLGSTYDEPKNREESEAIVNSSTRIFAIITSIFAIGGLIGGLLTRFWLNVFGLKWGIFTNNFLVIISAALMGFSKQANMYIMLIAGRFLIGVNSGLNAGLAPMYLSEIAPLHLRGGIGSFYQLFLTISILIAQVVSHHNMLGHPNKWPYLFAIPVIPAVLQAILLPLLPDSPRHLMGLKKEDEARKALEWFRHRHTADVIQEEENLKAEIEAENKMTSVNMLEMLKNPIFRKPLIISCMVMIGQQFSGINGIVQYSTSTLTHTKLDQQAAQIGTMLMGAMNVAMTIISTLTVDKAGRKTLLILGFGLMFVDSILLFFSMTIAKNGNITAAYLSIAFIVLFVVFFAIGPGSIPWFLVNELFLPRARTLAVVIAVPTNWLANFIVSMSYPLVESKVHAYTILIFAVFQILFLIYVKMAIPETKNRNIADIISEFGPSGESGDIPVE